MAVTISQNERDKGNYDTILWSGSPARIPYICSGVGAYFLIFSTLLLLTSILCFFYDTFLALELVFLGFFIGFMTIEVRFYIAKRTYYICATNGLYIHSTAFGQTTVYRLYSQITEHILHSISPVEKMFRVDTIRFYSGRVFVDEEYGTTKKLFEYFHCIEQPHTVLDLVRSKVAESDTASNTMNGVTQSVILETGSASLLITPSYDYYGRDVPFAPHTPQNLSNQVTPNTTLDTNHEANAENT